MLKITNGLKPAVEDGVSTYTDSEGRRYVRIKTDDEDFCLAAQDYVFRGDCVIAHEFTWEDALMKLADIGLSMPTKEQFTLCMKHGKKIDDKLKEIGGEALATAGYWMSAERGSNQAWYYNNDDGKLHHELWDYIRCNVRPVLNL